MKTSSLTRLSAAILGCSAFFQAPAMAQVTTGAPVTTAQCDQQFAQCFTDFGFFGFVICPAQYAQCAAAAISVPAEVSDAVKKVTACDDAAATCSASAETDLTKLAACSQTQAQCIMTALGIEPIAQPPAPSPDGSAACTTASDKCVKSATKVEELAQCASDLLTCLVPPAAPTK